jgi:hypothetical protein
VQRFDERRIEQKPIAHRAVGNPADERVNAFEQSSGRRFGHAGFARGARQEPSMGASGVAEKAIGPRVASARHPKELGDQLLER